MHKHAIEMSDGCVGPTNEHFVPASSKTSPSLCRIDMCEEMCIDTCVDICIGMCIDMCMHMCIHMCISMCVDGSQ